MAEDRVFHLGQDREMYLVHGDITEISVDAIVNAANSELMGGGGVDGAIHARGGPEIMAELNVIRRRIGRCEPGDAVVTGAGRLPARYVFHTVGPRYRDGEHGEPVALESCYETCLRLARDLGVKTISFPSISTGVYGYSLGEASEIAIRSVQAFLRESPGSVEQVKLVQFSESDNLTYRAAAEALLGRLSAAG